MELVSIVKHESPVPVYDYGDILLPFDTWSNTGTGAGWYSNFPGIFYSEKFFLPLYTLEQNSWEAMKKVNICFFEFRDLVRYTCPYNGYEHFWCVPTHIFSDDISFWLERHKINRGDMFKDLEWAKKFHSPRTENGLRFTKVQRSLLGTGFTQKNKVYEGKVQIHDAIIALENGDFLGCKVWLWFSKDRGATEC